MCNVFGQDQTCDGGAEGECVVAYVGQRTGEHDGIQSAAPAEGSCAYFGNALGNVDALKIFAVCKGVFTKRAELGGEGERDQIGAILKCAACDDLGIKAELKGCYCN